MLPEFMADKCSQHLAICSTFGCWRSRIGAGVEAVHLWLAEAESIMARRDTRWMLPYHE